MTTLRRALLASALSALLLAGCGGGDGGTEQTTEVAQETGDVDAYCALSAEMDAQDGRPSEEQLAEIEQLAPEEISEEVGILVEAVREENFDDPAVAEAEETLLAWEDENCEQAGAGATEATS